MVELERAATALGDALRAMPGVERVTVAGLERSLEVQVSARDGARASLPSIVRALALSTQGELVGTELASERSRRVRVRAGGEERIEAIGVPTSDGAVVPLGQVASLTHGDAPIELRRCGATRCALVLVEASSADALGRAREHVERAPSLRARWR